MRALVAVRSGGRVRTQWMALAAALVVLAGVVVAWAVSAAGSRVLVVQVAQPIQAGAPIGAADLMTASVAFDAGVEGLVPAASLDALLGRRAAIDLEPGVLLQRGMWRDGESLQAGERAVGAVLSAGRFPPGLAAGDVVLGASIGATLLDGGSDGGPGSDGDAADGGRAVAMRVTDVVPLDGGAVSVSLAVRGDAAMRIAQLAATDQLVVVRVAAGDGDLAGSPA